MLPDFIVIGAMKAGTSSLSHYLRSHPEIFIPVKKELNYFVEERNWSQGLSWYEEQFKTDDPNIRLFGEASTNYSKYPKFAGVSQKIVASSPDVKLSIS